MKGCVIKEEGAACKARPKKRENGTSRIAQLFDFGGSAESVWPSVGLPLYFGIVLDMRTRVSWSTHCYACTRQRTLPVS